MSDPLERRRESARNWLDYARRDLKGARASLADDELFGLAAYHAQQAAEKALKAYAVWLGADEIPRTHELGRLARLVRRVGGDPVPSEGLDSLTDYAVDGRYPDAPIPTREIAAHALEVAVGVYDFVKERVG